MYKRILSILEDDGYSRGVAKLKKDFEELCEWYSRREKYRQPFRLSNNHYLSYTLARMPATYMVEKQIMTEVVDFYQDSLTLTSHLDLCSGPGTFSWVVKELYPDIQRTISIEKEDGFIQLGKTIESEVGLDRMNVWRCEDIRDAEFPASDLVTIGYGLNEFSLTDCEIIIRKAFNATNKLFVIADTGTPEDYDRILRIRQMIVECGGAIIAPCMHDKICPYRNHFSENSWCHFSMRIPRTKLQRFLKGGELAFEDERYTWLVISKDKRTVDNEWIRILNHPRKNKRGVDLTMCTALGTVEEITVTKSDKASYKKLVKVQWGDCCPCPQENRL